MLHPPHVGWLAHDAPGGFSALMDLYECNYINMRRLLPIMPPASAVRVSRTPGGMDLHLRVVERCRYTSELILTYQFGQEQGPPVAEPDLRIRVYHDARLAEVVTAHLRYRVSFATDPLDSRSPDRNPLCNRWRINRFLYKWLTYCWRQGHRFVEPHQPPA
ncbi:MAG: DUF1249 domain-containing protein [Candidatus Competibacteraceae bacterium]|nr:DUF1249 domain-containing protein [Candidatus Competibacteraceae bacterium]MCP5126204.1 DUF1249 domain-containing protein [Gammaproteobacteria bacterium]HRX70066.1 DUF1249 domain-containing protein [Candidatus Competibacteraceae bacterium]